MSMYDVWGLCRVDYQICIRYGLSESCEFCCCQNKEKFLRIFEWESEWENDTKVISFFFNSALFWASFLILFHTDSKGWFLNMYFICLQHFSFHLIWLSLLSKTKQHNFSPIDCCLQLCRFTKFHVFEHSRPNFSSSSHKTRKCL